MRVFIRPDGKIEWVDDPRLTPVPVEFGPPVSRRAGRVEPVRFWPRLLFRALRRGFGRDGRVAAWTRRWRGPWRADLRASGGPCVRADTHAAAVAAEIAWLESHNLGR